MRVAFLPHGINLVKCVGGETTVFHDKLDLAVKQYFMQIPTLETDNNPSCTSRTQF